MLDLILGSGLGQILAGTGALIAVIFGAWMRGRSSGANKAKTKAKEADHERANEIRETKDEALRRLDGDTRPVDERMQQLDGFRD
jgi:hypothetical protein